MISRKASFAVGALTAVIVAGAGTAVAATGGAFILGKSNTARATTTLSNPTGTPLSLKAKSGSAPMRVNSSKVVTNLNADKLDGKQASSFALTTGDTGTLGYFAEWVDLDENGTQETLLAYAECPTGTVMTGGGMENWTGYPTMVSEPGQDDTWYVLTDGELGVTNPQDVSAWVVCYNPKGKVPGALAATADAAATSHPAAAQVPLSVQQKLDRLAARR